MHCKHRYMCTIRKGTEENCAINCHWHCHCFRNEKDSHLDHPRLPAAQPSLHKTTGNQTEVHYGMNRKIHFSSLQTYTDCPPPLLSGCVPWCRHQMETFSALVAICAGNSPVSAEFPAQRPVTRSFDMFCDLRLNKRLGKQPWGWWFETPLWSLWRHCNAISDCDIEPLFCTSTHSNIYVLSNGVNIHLWDMLSNYRPLTSFPPLLSK